MDTKAINVIRALSADMVQRANSGHPGLPLGAAPAAYTLWRRFMRHNPKNPDWADRDRFVLSAGHGSALLYSLLHVFGYGLTIDDLKRFRQFGSKTPGHPERGHTPGVEVTTGPLGQGIANAVGLALAESYLARKFNREGLEIVNHRTYALCGDGCLMEGISYEAASLAGTLGLSKLTILYDSNGITIEGSTDIAFRENVCQRFEAMGWNAVIVADGNDIDAIARAIRAAKSQNEKPTLIEIKTVIGFGAPNKQGKSSSHGEPLGAEETALLKRALGIDETKEFYVPGEVYDEISTFQAGGQAAEEQWKAALNEYGEKYPELYKEYMFWMSGAVDEKALSGDGFSADAGKASTRALSGKLLNKAAEFVPNLIGGSADLAPSNVSRMNARGDYSRETPEGSNLHFGIREHAMAAAANGIALHGGLKPYTAGFFIFSDYMKPAIRMAALTRLPVIYIFTHDSIGVGEDGPTHQPIEQLASLRSIPGLTVFRPCGARETAAAWRRALTAPGPTALVLTRQAADEPRETTPSGALRGGYILKDSAKPVPDMILIASGSELPLVSGAREKLAERGIDARVVSMPSMGIFEEQDADYRESVLPQSVRKRLAVEAGSSFGWHKYIGLDGKIISIDCFGLSAPADKLFEHFGFTVQNVVEAAAALGLS